MLGLHSCACCGSAMLMFVAIEKAIYTVCPLSKCNSVCSALIAAIYVCPFVKSVNANNTCSGANLYSSPAPRCCCIKLKRFGVFLTGATLRCTLRSCVPLQCCWCYSELTAILYVCPCVLCSVQLLLVLYLMCNIWDRTRLLYNCATQRSSSPSVSEFTDILKSDQGNVPLCTWMECRDVCDAAVKLHFRKIIIF